MQKPFTQWTCDVCGEMIQKPEHGYVQWVGDLQTIDGTIRRADYGFRIVHQWAFSPFQDPDRCYYPKGTPLSDGALPDYLGSQGLIHLLSLVDPGEFHQPTYRGPSVTDFRSFTEVLRRLQVPYYEEARRYWPKAIEDGFFEDANEVWVYLEHVSKQIIEKYGTKDAEYSTR